MCRRLFSKPLAAWDGRTPTPAQRLRCATFLLQLLSSILKAERGASHPERSNYASASQGANTNGDDEIGCEWEREAPQACARASNAYLGGLVRAAAALKARGQGGDDRCSEEHVTVGLDGEDDAAIGFWVLSFLSDVLKCLRKDHWSCGDSDSTLVMGCKRKRDGEARGLEVVSCSPPSAAAAAVGIGTADVYVSNDDGRGSSGRVVDISGLAQLVAAFPVGRGNRAMDLALKWVEVIQASGCCWHEE